MASVIKLMLREYDPEAGTAKLLLNRLSNEGNGYDNSKLIPEILTQTAGNRSNVGK